MLIHIDTDELFELARQWRVAAEASARTSERVTELVGSELADVLLAYGIDGVSELLAGVREVVAGGDGLLVGFAQLERAALELEEERVKTLVLEGLLPAENVVGWLWSHHGDIGSIYSIINDLSLVDQGTIWWFQGDPLWKRVLGGIKGPAGDAFTSVREFLGIAAGDAGWLGKAGVWFGKVAGVGGKFLGPIGAAWYLNQVREDLLHPKYGDDGVRNYLQVVEDEGWAVASIFPAAVALPGGIWLGRQVSEHFVPDAAHQGWHEISGIFTGKQGLSDLQDIATQADHQSSGGPFGLGSDRGKAEQFLRDQLNSYAVQAAVKTGNASELGQLSEWIRLHGYPEDIWKRYHNVAQAIADGKASGVQTQADATQFIQTHQ